MELAITLLYYTFQALQIYLYILIADVLLSWLPEIRQTTIGHWIHRLANPYMRLFRGWLVIGMFDFTPIIGFMLYQFGLSMVGRMIQLMILNL